MPPVWRIPGCNLSVWLYLILYRWGLNLFPQLLFIVILKKCTLLYLSSKSWPKSDQMNSSFVEEGFSHCSSRGSHICMWKHLMCQWHFFVLQTSGLFDNIAVWERDEVFEQPTVRITMPCLWSVFHSLLNDWVHPVSVSKLSVAKFRVLISHSEVHCKIEILNVSTQPRERRSCWIWVWGCAA